MTHEAPTNGKPVLLFHPDWLDWLSGVGRSLPFADIWDAVGYREESLVAFTDYAGDAPQCRYDTYATYVTGWSMISVLAERLRAVKREAGIEERTFDFKSRVDRRRIGRLRAYLARFRMTPGLVIVICVDKRIWSFRSLKRDWKGFEAEAKAKLGARIDWRLGDRTARAVSFLAVLGPLISADQRLLWVSDSDKIFDGGRTPIIGDLIGSIVAAVTRHPLRRFGFAPKPLSGDHELMLTLPDLVAGALSTTLPVPFTGGARLANSDRYTDEIVAALATFSAATERGGTNCKQLVIALEADPSAEKITSFSGALSRNVIGEAPP